MNSRVFFLFLGSALALAACSEQKTPAPVAGKPAPATPAPAPTLPPGDRPGASTSGQSDPECVGPIDPGVPEKLAAGGRSLEVNGYRLRLESADADDAAAIGVLANLGEASPENLFNLDRYLAFFAEHGVELIVVAGDVGDDRSSIERALRKIAAAGLPTVVIAGNVEAKSDFVDAVNAVRRDRPNLVNGNRVRWIDWDDVDLVTLPGYHDPRYLQAGESGCRYHREDVEAVLRLAVEANHPVLLVAHGAPRGDGPVGLDAIAGEGPEAGRNVGDPNLSAAIAAARIPFGVFPNIREAGGRAAADPGGAPAVAEGTPSDTLFLNPGAADSLPWTMNDGSTAQGMAAVIGVKGRQASYRLYRAPALTDAEKAQAEKRVLAEPIPGPGAGSDDAPDDPGRGGIR